MEEQAHLAIYIALASTGMFLMFLAIILVTFKYHRKVLEKQIKIQDLEHRRHIEIFLATIKAEERQKESIAKNLHDTINPNLSIVQRLLKNYKENAQANISDLSIVNRSEELVAQCVNGIREACFDLVPHALRHLGLAKAIEQLAFNIEKTQAAVCEYEFTMQENFSENTLLNYQLNIYRVTQELLNNILKHSHTKTISVKLKIIDILFSLIIEYDGIGIDNSDLPELQKKGLGLNSIESRVLLLDGKIDYQKGDKNRIILSVPLHAP